MIEVEGLSLATTDEEAQAMFVALGVESLLVRVVLDDAVAQVEQELTVEADARVEAFHQAFPNPAPPAPTTTTTTTTSTIVPSTSTTTLDLPTSTTTISTTTTSMTVPTLP